MAVAPPSLNPRRDDDHSAEASRDNVREQANRVRQLVAKGVYAKAREDQATKQIDVAEAKVREAQSEVERARQELGPQGNDNPQFREALAAVEQAKLNLVRTTVLAPSDGVIAACTVMARATITMRAQAEAVGRQSHKCFSNAFEFPRNS